MAEESISEAQHNELLFMQLVMMFQGMAMQQLGKVSNPVTQQVERDLGQAKNFIDLLAMIESKTTGNLNDQERQLLDHALFELRMNYVDETKKETSEATEGDQNEDGDEADEAEDAEGKDDSETPAE